MNRALRTPRLAAIALLLGSAGASLALAAPAQYTIDPEHTYPSFEASHMGISLWRGKFDRTTGTATLDEVAGRGTVDIVVDLKSADFGHAKLNEFMVGRKPSTLRNSPRLITTARSLASRMGFPRVSTGH